MKRFPSVKKNSDFQRAYQTGRSSAASALVMYVCENGCRHNRLGVSCSKKIGNSVVRHTFARKMREIFRLNDFRVKQGLDIIIVIRGMANYCTYTPTCSQYAIEAIRKYGCIKGSLLAAWRILRCNPWAKGGYDPVP